ncbi:DNA-binding response regulator [Enterococcus faecium]|uniref:response regulator transcription factor n=1 Tax=Enterococcus lactis TaxID=357441 RepID=UPI0019EFC3AA|nr:DNA-binding response regulator [Enterococcus faecium]EME8147889.1 response regulator transcription factor [Enterococcus faecium]
MKILVVEDNPAINKLLVRTLEKNGYTVYSVFTGKEAADIIEQQEFDLVLLDIMLPEIDGYEVFAYMREYDLPVIFLTAKDQLSDRVSGLRSGAEDYITKPFDLEELLARVEVVLRRNGKNDSNKLLKWQYIEINEKTRAVTARNQAVSLTPKEYELLLYLIRNKGIILPREKIYQKIWGREEETNSRTLDLHIQRIRNKLQLGQDLRTIYGVGYLLEG